MKPLFENIYSFEEFINEQNNLQNGELVNYMFFQNLELIKRNIETLMSLDQSEVDSTIQNGHDWASDHITVAAENIDQVTEFLTTTNESSSVSPQEKERLRNIAKTKLKEKVQKLKNDIINNPEKSDIYRLELDVVNAKLSIFAIQDQLKAAKERHAKMKK